jgi:hypothetical protein
MPGQLVRVQPCLHVNRRRRFHLPEADHAQGEALARCVSIQGDVLDLHAGRIA